jgi:hypothetical protein
MTLEVNDTVVLSWNSSYDCLAFMGSFCSYTRELKLPLNKEIELFKIACQSFKQKLKGGQ